MEASKETAMTSGGDIDKLENQVAVLSYVKVENTISNSSLATDSSEFELLPETGTEYKETVQNSLQSSLQCRFDAKDFGTNIAMTSTQCCHCGSDEKSVSLSDFVQNVDSSQQCTFHQCFLYFGYVYSDESCICGTCCEILQRSLHFRRQLRELEDQLREKCVNGATLTPDIYMNKAMQCQTENSVDMIEYSDKCGKVSESLCQPTEASKENELSSMVCFSTGNPVCSLKPEDEAMAMRTQKDNCTRWMLSESELTGMPSQFGHVQPTCESANANINEKNMKTKKGNPKPKRGRPPKVNKGISQTARKKGRPPKTGKQKVKIARISALPTLTSMQPLSVTGGGTENPNGKKSTKLLSNIETGINTEVTSDPAVQNLGSSQPEKGFLNPENLDIMAVLARKPRRATCFTCGEEFKVISSLKEHVKVHGLELPYNCTQCPNGYSNAWSLKLHFMSRHSGLKPHKCPHCEKAFPIRTALHAHIATHSTERNHVCEDCGKAFKSSATLRDHRRTHLEVDPTKNFLCHICSKAFRLKRHLKKHIKIHSKTKHKCDVCGKEFKRLDRYTNHIKLHTGEKSFVCHHCGEAFVHQKDHSRHVRKHEKPFTCSICQRGFSNRTTAQSHEETVHTNERRFRCNLCDKPLKSKHTLFIHGRRKHPGFILTDKGLLPPVSQHSYEVQPL